MSVVVTNFVTNVRLQTLNISLIYGSRIGMKMELVKLYLDRLLSARDKLESLSVPFSEAYSGAMDEFFDLNVALLRRAPFQRLEIIKQLKKDLIFLSEWESEVLSYIDYEIRFQAEAFDLDAGYYKFE